MHAHRNIQAYKYKHTCIQYQHTHTYYTLLLGRYKHIPSSTCTIAHAPDGYRPSHKTVKLHYDHSQKRKRESPLKILMAAAILSWRKHPVKPISIGKERKNVSLEVRLKSL